MDIESLKSKLDMSVSKLTGTEKALSEALKDYKQEKDKVSCLIVISYYYQSVELFVNWPLLM